MDRSSSWSYPSTCFTMNSGDPYIKGDDAPPIHYLDDGQAAHELYQRLSQSVPALREAPPANTAYDLSRSTPSLGTYDLNRTNRAYPFRFPASTTPNLSLLTNIRSDISYPDFNNGYPPVNNDYVPSPPLSPKVGALIPSRNPTTDNEDFIGRCFPLPDQEHLRTALRKILAELWWYNNRAEPEHAFDALVWKDEEGNFVCMICPRIYTRADRATAHIRKHLDHRPFVCNGEKCQAGLGKCNARFFSNECLTAHGKQNKIICPACGKTVGEKNVQRHSKSKSCIPPITGMLDSIIIGANRN